MTAAVVGFLLFCTLGAIAYFTDDKVAKKLAERRFEGLSETLQAKFIVDEFWKSQGLFRHLLDLKNYEYPKGWSWERLLSSWYFQTHVLENIDNSLDLTEPEYFGDDFTSLSLDLRLYQMVFDEIEKKGLRTEEVVSWYVKFGTVKARVRAYEVLKAKYVPQTGGL